VSWLGVLNRIESNQIELALNRIESFYSLANRPSLLQGSTSQSWRYNISVSGFITLGLVNIHAMHQTCGYIRKGIIYLTRKKQVVKWQTSPVSVLNCDTAVSRRFLEHLGLVSVLEVERLVSSRSWEFGEKERLGLISVLRVWKNGMSRSWRLTSGSGLGLVTEDLVDIPGDRGPRLSGTAYRPWLCRVPGPHMYTLNPEDSWLHSHWMQTYHCSS